MAESLRLMCILAHPDDESLGMGADARAIREGRNRNLSRHSDKRRARPLRRCGRETIAPSCRRNA